MALKTQLIDIPVSGGMQDKVDDDLLPQGHLFKVLNGRFQKEGRLSYRYGYDKTGNTGLDSAPNCLFDHYGGLCAHTVRGTYQFSEDNGNRWRLVENGGVYPAELESDVAVRGSMYSRFVDSAVWQSSAGAENLVILAWQERSPTGTALAIWYMVKEIDTGAVILPPTRFGSAGGSEVVHFPRVAVAGDTVAIFGCNASGHIYGIYSDVSSAPVTFSAPVQVWNQAVATYDVHGSDFGTFALVPAAGAGGFSVRFLDNALATVATQVSAEPSVQTTIGVWFKSGVVALVVYVSAGGVTANVFTTGSVGTPGVLFEPRGAGDTIQYLTVAPDNINDDLNTVYAGVFHDGNLGSSATNIDDYHSVHWAQFDIGMAVTYGPHKRYNLTLATKAFFHYDGGVSRSMVGVRTAYYNPYLNTTEPDGGEPWHHYPVGLIVTPYDYTYVDTDGQGGPPLSRTAHTLRVVARFLQDKIGYSPLDFEDIAGGGVVATYHLPGVHRLSSTYPHYYFARTVQVKIASRTGISGTTLTPMAQDNNSGGDLVCLRLQPDPLKVLALKGLSVNSGGHAGCFDSIISTEVQPHTAPALPIVEATTANSANYRHLAYRAVFYWYDAKGNLHRSAPSPTPQGHAQGGGAPGNVKTNKAIRIQIDGVTITPTVKVHVPAPTAHQGADRKLYVAIYRAVVEAAGAGTLEDGLYHLDTIAEVPEEPTAHVISVTVSGAHVDLSANPMIYTEGGVLESEAPPAATDVLVTKERVFLASGEASEVWFSKPVATGVAPEFNANLVIEVPDSGGHVTALAGIDDKLVIFKKEAIYYVVGDGPNASGVGGSFSPPRMISSDVGCINKNSVVEGPFGVMFESDKGIYLLDRSLTTHYVGASVEDQWLNGLGTRLKLVNAVLVPDLHEVRFQFKLNQYSLGETTVSTGRVLVYNYLFQKWSIYQHLFADCACLWRDAYAFAVDNAGIGYTRTVFKETDAANSDTVYYESEVITPWFHVANIDGFQRVRRAWIHGDYPGAGPSAIIEVGYDYDTSYEVNKQWTQAEMQAISGTSKLLEIHLPRQKCRAIRFRFRGTPTSVFGTWMPKTITLEVGVKRRAALPSNQKK